MSGSSKVADVSFLHLKTCMHVCICTYLFCVHIQEQVYTYTADTKYSPVTGDVKFGGFENFVSKIVLEFFFLRFVATSTLTYSTHIQYIVCCTYVCMYIYVVHTCTVCTYVHTYIHDCVHTVCT